jgi:hypothetical protein
VSPAASSSASERLQKESERSGSAPLSVTFVTCSWGLSADV